LLSAARLTTSTLSRSLSALLTLSLIALTLPLIAVPPDADARAVLENIVGTGDVSFDA